MLDCGSCYDKKGNEKCEDEIEFLYCVETWRNLALRRRLTLPATVVRNGKMDKKGDDDDYNDDDNDSGSESGMFSYYTGGGIYAMLYRTIRKELRKRKASCRNVTLKTGNVSTIT